MRTASMVLGIIGGAITTLISFLFLFSSAGILNTAYAHPSAKMGGIVFAVWGGLVLIGGVLGIVSGAMVRRKPILCGVLMIVAALLSFLSLFGFLAGIALLIGGIFAFINEQPPAYPYGYTASYAPPYPPQPAPTGTPQPAPNAIAAPANAPNHPSTPPSSGNTPAPDNLQDTQGDDI